MKAYFYLIILLITSTTVLAGEIDSSHPAIKHFNNNSEILQLESELIDDDYQLDKTNLHHINHRIGGCGNNGFSASKFLVVRTFSKYTISKVIAAVVDVS